MQWGDVLGAVGGLGAAIATGFAAWYGRKTWKVYEQQERHMATANEIQKSLKELAVQAGRAEKRARQAKFAPNLLLKNPRGVYVRWRPAGETPEFLLSVEWEVHNIGEGPAQALEAGPAISIDEAISSIAFEPRAGLEGRRLPKGQSVWVGVDYSQRASEQWAGVARESGLQLVRGMGHFDIEILKRIEGERPAVFVRCKDVFGNESTFGGDLEGNMRLVNSPFGDGDRVRQ